MKKLLLSIGLCALAFGASAQDFVSQNFLNVRALNVGTNTPAGLRSLTNLANVTTNAGMIYNPTNIAYTNLSGSYVHPGLTAVTSAVGTTNQYTTPALFKDVTLYPDRNGLPVFTYVPTVVENAFSTNSSIISGANLFIEYVNPWVTNGAIGLQFRPVWDGVSPNSYTLDDWWVVIPSSLGVSRPKGHYATNAPIYKWAGASSLRLVSITNNVTTITGTADTVTNSTFLTKILLNGFRP